MSDGATRPSGPRSTPFVARRLAAIAGIASVLLMAPEAHAQAYRCESSNGQVEFRDQPCAAGSVKKSIVAPPPAPAATPGLPLPQPTPGASAEPRERESSGPMVKVDTTHQPLSLKLDSVDVNQLVRILAFFAGRRLDDRLTTHEHIACDYRSVPWDVVIADVAARARVDISYNDDTLIVKNR